MLKENPKFQSLIPPLSPEVFAGLEQDIIATNGPLVPIAVWNGTIVDGHHRYAICQKHGLPFTTREVSFSSEAEAIAWMIKEQFNRRNMSRLSRTMLVLRAKDALIEVGRQKQGQRTDLAEAPHNTRKLIAERAGVSEGYVYQVDYVLQNGEAAIVQAMISEKMTVKEAYTKARRKDEKLEQRKQKREEARQAEAYREQPRLVAEQQTHPVGVQPRTEIEQACPAGEQPITQPNDLPDPIPASIQLDNTPESFDFINHDRDQATPYTDEAPSSVEKSKAEEDDLPFNPDRLRGMCVCELCGRHLPEDKMVVVMVDDRPSCRRRCPDCEKYFTDRKNPHHRAVLQKNRFDGRLEEFLGRFATMLNIDSDLEIPVSIVNEMKESWRKAGVEIGRIISSRMQTD